MTYKFIVWDDENRIPEQEFNRFVDAYNYAQRGLVTFIEAVPCIDGVCDRKDAKMCWSWDETWDKEKAINQIAAMYPDCEECEEALEDCPNMICKKDICCSSCKEIADELECDPEIEEVSVIEIDEPLDIVIDIPEISDQPYVEFPEISNGEYLIPDYEEEKKCCCKPECICGCQEGEECTCAGVCKEEELPEEKPACCPHCGKELCECGKKELKEEDLPKLGDFVLAKDISNDNDFYLLLNDLVSSGDDKSWAALIDAEEREILETARDEHKEFFDCCGKRNYKTYADFYKALKDCYYNLGYGVEEEPNAEELKKIEKDLPSDWEDKWDDLSDVEFFEAFGKALKEKHDKK